MKTEIKSSAEWQALLEKKEDEITVLHRQVEWLTQQLRLMQGQRAERNLRTISHERQGSNLPSSGVK